LSSFVLAAWVAAPADLDIDRLLGLTPPSEPKKKKKKAEEGTGK